jgi:hypothetical protein
VCHAHAANAQESREFGLGIIIGDPTGVSGKYLVSPEFAIDGAVGLGLIGGDKLHVHVDFLWQFDIKRWSSAQLDLYLGVGPKLGIKDKRDDTDLRIGARAPFGLAMMFLEAPFDVFVEVAAGLWLVRKPGFDLDVAIGGRYWF